MRRYFLSKTIPILLVVVACLSLNIVALVLYRKNQQIQQAGSWVEHTYEVISTAQGLLAGMQQILTGQRGYLLSASPKFLTVYDNGRAKVDASLAEIRRLTTDNPEQLRLLREYGEAIAAERDLIARQLKQFGGKPLAAGTIGVDDVLATHRLMDKIRANHKAVIENEERLLRIRDARENHFQNAYRDAIVMSSVLSVLGMIGGIGIIIAAGARQRLAEQALADSNERFALAIKGMQDGVFDYQYTAGNLYFSPRFKEMLGETDDAIDNSVAGIEARIHPDDLELARSEFEQLRRREMNPYSSTYRIRHRNGSWRWMLARGAGIWGKDGELKRLVGAYTDVTEQREREDSLRRINTELETFTYIASHDLRSPLVNLKGFAGEIQYGIDEITPLIASVEEKLTGAQRETFNRVLREELPDSLRFIQSSVVKMDRLTNAILELSRIGRHELKRIPIDVPRIVQTTLDALKHTLTQKSTVVCIGDLPALVSDPLLVEQVFGNIIDNAVKYLDPARPGKIEIDGEVQGESNLYRIKDNGRGIAKDDMHKVFEIFRRAGNNERIEGEGMGMSYVRATVRRLGGSIDVSSEPGVGTTFFVTFRNHQQERSAA